MFKDKVKEYRLKHNLSVEALAEKNEISKRKILAWEDGKRLPKKDELDKLCLYFNVLEKDLLEEIEFKRVLSRNKIKQRITKCFICSLIVIMSIILLGATITFIANVIDDLKPEYKSLRLNDHYWGKYVALEIGEEYIVNIDEVVEEKDIEYNKLYFGESEYYSFKNNTITPIKEGIFYVEIIFKNRKEKTIYFDTILKVFCYDKDNLIEINTVEDLCNMNKNKSGKYILNSNLDLKDIENFNPIGNFPIDNEFTGMFINPNGYVISNLTIKNTSEIYHGPYGGCVGGLFGSIKNAYIDSIILENVYIDVSNFEGTGWSAAGSIADLAQESLITNCKVNGTIVAQQYVGGIVGCSNYSTLMNNEFKGEIIQKNGNLKQNTSAGGIAGWLQGCHDGYDLYTGCEITGNIIEAKITSELIAGKVAGFIHGDDDCIHNNTIICELSAPEEFEFGKTIIPKLYL